MKSGIAAFPQIGIAVLPECLTSSPSLRAYGNHCQTSGIDSPETGRSGDPMSSGVSGLAGRPGPLAWYRFGVASRKPLTAKGAVGASAL